MSHTPMTPILFDALESQVDRAVHVRWANKACVWILREIIQLPTDTEQTGHLVILETPKTKKRITVNSKDLFYSRRNAEVIGSQTHKG